MNLNGWKSLYQGSPLLVKQVYSYIPWSLRVGMKYRQWMGFLNDSEFWTEEHWRSYQANQLRELLSHCSKNVPFYKDTLSSFDKSMSELEIYQLYNELPFTSKEDVINSESELISQGYGAAQLFHATTGGTTGKPVSLSYNKESFSIEWAFKHFFWSKALGYRPSSRKATFRGVAQGNKLYVKNPIYNEIRFSPFHLEKESDLDRIVDALVEYKPEYLHGYPSAIQQLSKHVSERGATFPDLRGIILISENIFPQQIELFKNVFECPVYSFYGLSEKVVFASMDNEYDSFYSHPAYGYVDLISSNGTVITNSGRFGEIVGTGFTNKGMPLLKYRTGDFAQYCNKSPGNWNMPCFSEIRGRWNQEFILGRGGQKLSLTALNMHSDIYENIKKMQIYQSEIGVVRLNIVKAALYSDEDERKIERAYSEKLGHSYDIEYNYVDSIPLTASGKDKYFLSEVRGHKN